MKRIFSKIASKMIVYSLVIAIAFTGSLAAMPTQKAEALTASTADRVIATAKRYLGTPYRFGAPAGVSYVFDCSSFTQYVFKKNGIYLPRTSYQQSLKGRYVSKRYLRKGDLVFFWTTRSGRGNVGHVGIYIGYGKFIHTFQKGIGVTISSLGSSYWSSHYVKAKRISG